MELTLEDLAREVSLRIQQAEVRQGNGQVSPFPDGRTLRYYTTIGLLDRPLAMRGRQAIYSDRHVHQAVAVKRLQAAGLSLGEIQTRLAGLPTPELAQVAGADLSVVRPEGRPLRTRQRWWTGPPPASPLVPAVGTGPVVAGTPIEMAGPVGPVGPVVAGIPIETVGPVGPVVAGTPIETVGPVVARTAAGPTAGSAAFGALRARHFARPSADSDAEPSAPQSAATPGPAATALTAVPLGAAATLLVPTGRPLTGTDLDAIRRAAAPLTDFLAAAGLTDPRPDPKDRS